MGRSGVSSFGFFALVIGAIALLHSGTWFLGAFFWGTPDEDHLFLAESLADEPIRVLRTYDAQWLSSYADHQFKAFPLGWSSMQENPISPEKYPSEARLYKRMISVESVFASKSQRIRVTVIPSSQNMFSAWLNGTQVVREAVVEAR